MLLSMKKEGFSLGQASTNNSSNFEKGWQYYLKEQWDSSIYFFNQVPITAKDKTIASFYSSKSHLQLNAYGDALKAINFSIENSNYKKEFWDLKITILEYLGDYKNLKKATYFVIEQEEGMQEEYLDKLLISYERYKFNKKDRDFIFDAIPFKNNSLNTRLLLTLVQQDYIEQAFEITDYLINQNPWEAHYYFLKHSLLLHLNLEEDAYRLMREMFDLFSLYPEVINTYFLNALHRNDVKEAQYILDKLHNLEAPLSVLYHLWDYILLQNTQKEWTELWIHSLQNTFKDPYKSKHALILDDYLINAFKKGYTEVYLSGIPIYFEINPKDYRQRVFYLKILEREHSKVFESELFAAIAIFPEAWELYEWAIRYYKSNKMWEEAADMEEAYLYEKEMADKR